MADLDAGERAKVALRPGDALRVSGGGAEVTVVEGGPTGTTVLSGQSQIFGPYGVPARLTILGTAGVVSYDLVEYLQQLSAAEIATIRAQQSMASGRAVNRTLKRFVNTVGVTFFDSGAASTPTIDSAAASPTGRAALKLAIATGNTYAEVLLAGLNLAAFDGHVAWRVWVEDHTKVQQIQVFAGTSGYSRFWQDTHRLNNSDENRWDGEHHLITGPTRAGVTNTFVAGTDTLADTKLRIFTNAATNVWVELCCVPGIGRPTHVITHDDCSVTWITRALPALARNSLQATFGINTGDIGGNPALYLSASQVQQIAAAGHQISPHNQTNDEVDDGSGGGSSPLTTSAYAAQFVAASAALSALVGSALDVSYHPWVQGRNNTAAHNAMRAAGMRLGRGTHSAAGYNFPQLGLGHGVMALKNQSLHTMSQAQILAAVQAVRKYGLTAVWMVHEVTPAGGAGVETAVANYEYLLGLIAAEVSQGAAVHRKAAELAREVYAERLVPAALLDL